MMSTIKERWGTMERVYRCPNLRGSRCVNVATCSQCKHMRIYFEPLKEYGYPPERLDLKGKDYRCTLLCSLEAKP